jgi:hypothetical protein
LVSYLYRIIMKTVLGWQVNTVPNTDLKFQVSIESGTSLTTIPGRLRRPTTYKLEGATLLQQQVSDLYSPAPVTLSGGASSGLHRVVIKSIGQEESSPTAGHMFAAYGSVVRTTGQDRDDCLRSTQTYSRLPLPFIHLVCTSLCVLL